MDQILVLVADDALEKASNILTITSSATVIQLTVVIIILILKCQMSSQIPISYQSAISCLFFSLTFFM